MKTKAVFILLVLMTCTNVLTAQENGLNIQGNETVIIKIAGMACQEGCADKIAENLGNLKGVQSAEVSFETGNAVVSFDSNKTSIDFLKTAITSTKVKDYVYTVKEVIKTNEILK